MKITDEMLATLKKLNDAGDVTEIMNIVGEFESDIKNKDKNEIEYEAMHDLLVNHLNKGD